MKAITYALALAALLCLSPSALSQSPGDLRTNDLGTVERFDGRRWIRTDRVATVAELLTLAPPDGTRATTAGYSAAGIGANTYQYDADSTATIDGGFVLPGIGGVMSLDAAGEFDGDTGDGRWIAIDTSVAHVDQFGAVFGDAAYDSRKFIQRAIDSAGDGLVIFTPGQTYYLLTHRAEWLSAGLTIDEGQNGITIDGRDATLYVGDNAVVGSPANVILITATAGQTASDITIRNFTIDANNANQSQRQHGIAVTQRAVGDTISRVTLENITVQNAIEVSGGTAAGFWSNGDQCRFVNCIADSCGAGFGFVQNYETGSTNFTYYGKDLKVVDCGPGWAYDWSGISSDRAYGYFENLEAIRSGQMKTQGAWELTVNGLYAHTIPLFKVADAKQVNLRNLHMENVATPDSSAQSGYGSGSNVIQAASSTESISIDGLKIIGSGNSNAPLINLSCADMQSLSNATLDCDSNTNAINVQYARADLRNIRILNNATTYAIFAYSPVYGKNIEILSNGYAYDMVLQSGAAGSILENLTLEQRIYSFADYVTLRNCDMSDWYGNKVYGPGGGLVYFEHCESIATSNVLRVIDGILYTTAADFADDTSAANTIHKHPTRRGFDTTNGRMVYASGAAAADPWHPGPAAIEIRALSADPADPPNGQAVRWLSDGTESGDDGDVMIKITNSAGVTKTATLVDHSSL